MSSTQSSDISSPFHSPTLRRAGIAIGVLSIVLGILVLVLPGATLVLLAVLFGLELIFIGGVRIAVGAALPAGSGWVKPAAIVLGVLTILAGIFCFVHPGASLVFLAIFLGVGWIIDGVGTLAHAFGSTVSGGRTLAIINGITTIVAGLAVTFFPGASLVLLVRVGGIALIILGLVQIMASAARRS